MHSNRSSEWNGHVTCFFFYLKLCIFFSREVQLRGRVVLLALRWVSCPLLSSRLFRLGASVTVMTTVNVSLSSEAAAADRAGKLACRIGFELNWPDCTFHTWLTTPAPPSSCLLYLVPASPLLLASPREELRKQGPSPAGIEELFIYICLREEG